MPSTMTFTDKEVSIIEAALEDYLDMNDGGSHYTFSKYDVAELVARITERIAW